MNRLRLWSLTVLVLLAAVSRLLPHPPNVAPLAAMALFGGATFPTRRSAVLVTATALLLSDLLLHLGYLAGRQPYRGVYPGQWAVYACFLVTVLLGCLLRRHRGVAGVVLATVAGSAIFFVVTNFVVWAGGSMYPRTVQGLLLCYEMALPFFRSTLAGDIVYSAVLFGTLALAEAGFPMLREPAAQARVV
jgi:hypothetical protein